MFLNKWNKCAKRPAQNSGKQRRKRARSNSLLGIELLEQRMAPAVVATVTNPIDENDATPPSDYVGGDGLMSLREAINYLDANGGGILAFTVPKVSVTLGPLPPITAPVTIDVPLAADGVSSSVEISGGGLDLKAPGNKVKGLTINSVLPGTGLTVEAG